MSNITSTLSLRVNDDGFASKLQADAEAARRLGISAKDLGKLRAGAGTSKLVSQFEKLGATAKQLDAFQGASRGLQGLGASFRNARADVERTTKALTAAQRRVDFFDRSKASGSANYPAFKQSGLVDEARSGLRAAARAHTAAKRTLANTEAAFREQRTTVDSMGRALEQAGHPVANLARTQADLRKRMDDTSAAIRRQATAHEQARVAATATRAETERNATAQLRATVHGGNAVRAEREARRAAAAGEARQANATALRRTVEAGRQARADSETAVAQEARRRANAGRDMAAGMGGAGRRQAADIEGGRRVADGMSRPARDARASAEADKAAGEAEDRRAARNQARGTIAGAAGLVLGHKVKEGTKATLETYGHLDFLRRKQAAVADLSEEESFSRVKQGRHIGVTTPYNDLQVMEAQLDLAQRGVKKEFIEPFIGEISNFAQAMGTTMPEAAKTMEGIIFSTNQNVEDAGTAQSVMRRQIDIAVKASKIGGLDNDDLAQAMKFGGGSGSGAGLSNETMLATFGLLRRSGYNGSEAGVATRAFAGKLVSPTMKGLDALDAMGVKWEDFTKIKRGSQPELADNMMKRHFGKGLSKGQRGKMQGILEDEDVMGDRQKFVEAAVDAVSDSFVQTSGKNKGKLSVVDRKALAKQFGNFHKNLIESVDAEGLWSAIIHANPTLAQANAWGTDKHGGKIMALSRKANVFDEQKAQIQHTPEGFSRTIGDAIMAGFYGASQRLQGNVKNLESAVGQSLDNDGKGGLLTGLANAAANATHALSELPSAVLAAGATATWLGGKASTLIGGAVVTGTAAGITTAIGTGSGAIVAAVAGSLAAAVSPVALTAAIGAALISADKSKGLVHGGKNLAGALNPGDELPGLGVEYATPRKTGSLPPGTAGIPQPAPARLPGLDGRPKAAPVEVRQPGFGDATPKIPPMATGRPAPVAPVAPAETIAPKVETGAIENLHARADELKEALQAAGGVTVAPQASPAGLSGTLAIAKELLATLQAIPGAIASSNGAVRGLQGRSSASRSFSDGVTPGAGAQ